MRIAVIDGQGGGIGKAIVEKLKNELNDKVEIIALGTNVLATSAMLRAGAAEGASGENAIIFNSSRVDIIMGPIGIIAANSMLGELTPKMAAAIGESHAKKILVPVSKCNIQIAGGRNMTLPNYVEDAVAQVIEIMNEIKEQ